MALAEALYDKLTDQEDARLCDDISEDACQESPRSFVLILLTNGLTKLGDAMASPKTTLAWACTVIAAPAFVLGFLVPIRESGSMIPQIFIGSVIRRLPVRKWVYVLGSLGQCLAIVAIGLTVMFLRGAVAGWLILGLITLFSLSRGFCSVASKDVLGKTIPKPKRGQLSGWSASAAGLVSIMVGIVLLMPSLSQGRASWLGWVIIAAGMLWLLAAAMYAQIAEFSGETGGGRNGWAALKQLKLLVEDQPFRRFVITRALLMCSALSAPFYIALAQKHIGSPAYLLGLFVIAAGAADLFSAPFWGRFADLSSKGVMIWAALVTATIGLLTFAIDLWWVELNRTVWFLPLAYFVLSIAHSGVRVGRKTYVVNLASGNKRTDYVAISNSVIGVMLLLVGSVGALAPLIGNAGVVAVLALMGLAGALLGTSLPPTETN